MANLALHLPPKTDKALIDWIRLSRSENVGPLTFHRLLERYKTPADALEALPELAAQGGLKRPLKIATFHEAEKELENTRAFRAEIITSADPLYPPLLRQIESAPPLLAVKGNAKLLQKPYFAIVGARNASAVGKKLAYQFADQLGSKGWGIVSGLARGIDAAAHQGSLHRETVAVLAGGLDQIYPPENAALYHQIAEAGVLIAESPWGMPPQSSLFPRRNRIISGISRSVLVVEAALKSGSLLTARYALEQGRDVFAVPGHPLDPRARGCNQLIKTGAILVEILEDIEQEISPHTPLTHTEPPSTFELGSPATSWEEMRKILNENLSYTAISIDELIRECQFSPSDMWMIFLEMEIAGRIERFPGGKVALKEEWRSL